MIRLIRNCKVCLISVLIFIVCLTLSTCSDTERKSIILYDYRLCNNDTRITLGLKLQDKLYYRKIFSHTKSVRIIKGSEICSVEHDSSFCTKIISNNSNINVYIFPNGAVKNDYDSYIVSDAKEVYAFFINDDAQPLSCPYAGYVIQDSKGDFLLLSTLWDGYTVN